MSPRTRRTLLPALFALLLLAASSGVAQTSKRPLRPGDYDRWKSIQSVVLSPDGKHLAYNLMTQNGDGELVVRPLGGTAEWRFPRGRGIAGPAPEGNEPALPTPTAPTRFGRVRGPEGPTLFGATTHQFTPDGKALVFVQTPTQAELDRAREEKKKPEEMPRPAVAVLDLASGKVAARVERSNIFTLGGIGAGVLICRRESRSVERPTTPPSTGTPTTPRPPSRTYGGDVVVRNLADGSERVLPDVTEFSLTKDGKLLVYIVSSRKEETNGVYALSPLSAPAPTVLLGGKGKYSRLTWDENQTQLVFAADREEGTTPRFRVHHWDRNKATLTADAKAGPATPAAALELLGASPTGLRSGWVISERAGFSFSPDGTRLYLSTGPVPAAPPVERTGSESSFRRRGSSGGGDPADENKVTVDLWHYKDEYIQPMQRLRAGSEGSRSYRAVYHLKDKVFRQLADETLDIGTAAEGEWTLGNDTRPYRQLTGYGASLSDLYLVNVKTGERKSLFKEHAFGATLSPRGRYLLAFDGKHWNTVSVPAAKLTCLTGKLPVKFANEEWDQPSDAPSYGVSGWTADEKYVLLNDRYDVWQVAADGSEAKMLTGGLGRKTQTQLRLLRPGEDRPERGVDLSKPLLFKADNLATRDEGFYRLRPGAAPELLIMGARSYGIPVKAKNADVYLLTVSSFHDFPDYFVTDGDFRELRRVTDANPHKKDLLWGKAELVKFKNLDGAELSGMLIKPGDFDPAKKYPMIVYIYERLSQNLHRFVPPAPGTSINPSYYASNGYVVFMPDIVYKVGTPGQSALKCVLPGIQAVLDKGFVDESAIGIQGHSWGGYQIAYMITQTGRFKAAAAGAPVSNMVSAYGGVRWGSGMPRQFQYERTQSRIGATLWQKPHLFIENSPIFMADRVQTPLLMLHNDQDDAVPWYQGIEYFLALRRLGKECYLFNYNGELHGLRRRANQRDYTMRMQQFFDHHLKGAAKPSWMEKGIPYLERDKEKEQWKE